MFQIIVKEKGVFTNVTSPSTKAKLRILFEVAPLALLVRCPFRLTLDTYNITYNLSLKQSQPVFCTSRLRGWAWRIPLFSAISVTLMSTLFLIIKTSSVMYKCSAGTGCKAIVLYYPRIFCAAHCFAL